MSSSFETPTPWWKVLVRSVPEVMMIASSVLLAIIGIASTIFAIGATVIGLLGLVAKRRRGDI